MNCNFQVGDRVRIIRHEGGARELVGLTGTVCSITNHGRVVGVEHDGISEYLHNCNGACRDRGGFWYFNADQQLEKIDSANVQIDTLDGLI